MAYAGTVVGHPLVPSGIAEPRVRQVILEEIIVRVNAHAVAGVGNHVAPGLGNIAVSRVAGDGVAVTGVFNVQKYRQGGVVPAQKAQGMAGLTGGHIGIFSVRVKVHAIGDAKPFTLAYVAVPLGVILFVFAHAVVFAANAAANHDKINAGIFNGVPVNGALMVADIKAVISNAAGGNAVGTVGGSVLLDNILPLDGGHGIIIDRHAIFVAEAVFQPVCHIIRYAGIFLCGFRCAGFGRRRQRRKQPCCHNSCRSQAGCAQF